MAGKFPSTDQFGNNLFGKRAFKANQEICGGWRAGFDCWTGDWKERSLSHSFIGRNYQSMRVCDQCLAVKPFSKTPEHLLPLIFTDFSEQAPWRATIQSHEEYLRTAPPTQRTPWLEVPGFLISRVKWDSAHTILLGTRKDVAASVLFDMVFGLEFRKFSHCRGVPKWWFSRPVVFFWESLEYLPKQKLEQHLEVAEPHLVALFSHGLDIMADVTVVPGDQGNILMGKLGSTFRKWCRFTKKVEIPPCAGNLHLLGRGDNDKRNFPELDSNVKAAHTKTILFFICDLTKELSSKCQCA